MTQSGASSYEDVQINIHHLLGAILKRLPRILIVTILVAAAVYVLTSMMTPKYDATASILVEARLDTFVSADERRQNGSSQAADDAAIASQIQLLKSRETLLQVVDQLDLRSNPEFTQSSGGLMSTIMGLVGREQTAPSKSLDDRIVAKLNGNIVASRARDSRVIDITYRSESRQTAADVANALAAALEKRRSNLTIEDTANATRWLEQEIDRLRKDVAEAENKVAEFRVNNDLFTGQSNNSLLGQQLSEISRQISAASERKNAALTRSRLIQDLLKKGQPVESVPDVRESPIVQRMLEQKANFQASRAQNAATLLDNHPTIQSLDAQISDINAQIAAEGRRIAQALATQAEIEAELEKSLQDDLTRLKLSASNAERSGVTLAELEREASAQRDLLNTFLARLSEATARTNSGATFPDVRTISTASVPNSPASPKKTMLTIVAASLALVVQIGSIIVGELASGRLVHLRHEKAKDEGRISEKAAVAAVPSPVSQQANEAPAPAAPEEPDNASLTDKQDDVQHKGVFAQKDVHKIANSEPKISDDLPVVLSELSLSQQHIILVATPRTGREDQKLAAELMTKIAANGQTAVLVNAGGADHLPDTQGLSDLCDGETEFGDIIHGGREENLFFVPWGTKERLRFNSPDFMLLIDALSALYDFVIVECGQLGARSPIVAFADSGAHLLLPSTGISRAHFDKIRADAQSLGLGFCRITDLEHRDSDVA
ncbi:exopolysaccharide transport family protein [Maritalea mediterranea]|uniref:Exopolysaccharide transport family protein n=1 Tax=Maritalea mediterranea TaxID=2909667 RepID=A0ABS9E7P3_9HYPH|nr:exopolysaccharide transport family protein [Maritalea mediterranea]MCF4098212.1 exopolysaccharide transport family protein [Maritalea mediterranea]